MDKRKRQQIIVVVLIVATTLLGIAALVIANRLSQSQAPEDSSAAVSECDPNAYELNMQRIVERVDVLRRKNQNTVCKWILCVYMYEDSQCICKVYLIEYGCSCAQATECASSVCLQVFCVAQAKSDNGTLGATMQSGDTGFSCTCVRTA